MNCETGKERGYPRCDCSKCVSLLVGYLLPRVDVDSEEVPEWVREGLRGRAPPPPEKGVVAAVVALERIAVTLERIATLADLIDLVRGPVTLERTAGTLDDDAVCGLCGYTVRDGRCSSCGARYG